MTNAGSFIILCGQSAISNQQSTHEWRVSFGTWKCKYWFCENIARWLGPFFSCSLLFCEKIGLKLGLLWHPSPKALIELCLPKTNKQVESF